MYKRGLPLKVVLLVNCTFLNEESLGTFTFYADTDFHQFNLLEIWNTCNFTILSELVAKISKISQKS